MQLTFCFIVCENLFPEVEAAVRQQGLSETEVRAFPSHCSSAPLQWSELSDIVGSSEASVIIIFGSYCLRQLVDPPAEFSRCQVEQQGQCFHLLCNPTLVDTLQKNGTYLLSPGWLSNWQTHMSTWGFDQSTAVEFFGKSLRKLLLLDTGTDQETTRHLAELGKYLELPTESLSIGLEYLELLLLQITGGHQKREQDRKVALWAMTLDLIRSVTRAKNKSEAIATITELFTMLFDPQKMIFIPVDTAGVHFDQAPGLTIEEQDQIQHFYIQKERSILLDEKLGSFLLRIGEREETLALVFIFQVSYPQYIASYLNIALPVSEVCALSLKHAETLNELVRTSHLAGKAEVATEVLHNVGNTLNSILVSSEHIREKVQQSSGSTLPGIVQLIQEHEHDREHFYTHDPRGQKLPVYFAKLSDKLLEEREFMLSETTRQLHHIRRVADIIQAQQDTAKHIDFMEQVDLTSLLEESLEFFQSELEKQGIIVDRQYDVQQSILSEPHKILQIINNLIGNAVDAFDGVQIEQQRISLRIYPAGQEEVIVEVCDNGKGMEEGILQQAFVFGFTTKETGHGFGLHNAANLAAEMGGSLTGESKGPGLGARFIIRLPVVATGKTGGGE